MYEIVKKEEFHKQASKYGMELENSATSIVIERVKLGEYEGGH